MTVRPPNEQWIYKRRPTAEVTAEHYARITTALPDGPVVPGTALVAARFISVDPYMRIQQSAYETWEAPHPLDTVQGGAVVGRIEEVDDPTGRFAVGDWVETYMGWQHYAIRSLADCRKLDPAIAPPSTALGVLGMPGRTAYFGLFEVGRPRAGDTVLVSGAAGAVGSIVGQLAKLSGCRVVGVVGSSAKAAFVTEELGFDDAIDYRQHGDAAAMRDALAERCPAGIDVYFDNVGGTISDAALVSMRLRGRIVLCGQISQYSGGLDQPNLGPRLLHHVLYKRLTIQGVLARDYATRMDEMLERMAPWVAQGRVKFRETRWKGFERLPEALNALFHGANEGKMIVEV